ncbi:MAG: type II toxin-antitoxin system VapC family toxin [Methanosphaera stadtmanae]|nr:type II toxin-antitoxin system VapC family toxin [Methanosphaera stadtmanae]MBE6493933.1 type II toxin-antitoxin system VapC family toxin [Methanosphaera stadtmanae]
MKILLDTSFIVSLFRENDENHQKAKENAHIIEECDCYITNYILNEVITIIAMRTKDIKITETIYYFMLDNFTIINEQETSNFNTMVMKIFKKYNKDTFHLSFIDCSLILLYNEYNLDVLVSFDKWFKKVEEIKTYEFI